MLNRSQQMLNNLYGPTDSFHLYNHGGLPYDPATLDALNRYTAVRDAIYAASASASAGDVKTTARQFIHLTDAAANAYIDVSTQSRQYSVKPGAYDARQDIAMLDQRTKDMAQHAQDTIAESIAAARAMLPKLEADAWLSIQAPEPMAINSPAMLDRREAKRKEILFALQTGGNVQATAQRLAALAVTMPDMLAAYELMNGSLDLAMQAVNVNLVTLHKAYATAVLAQQMQTTPGERQQALLNQTFTALLNDGSIAALPDTAQTLASRMLAIALQTVQDASMEAQKAMGNNSSTAVVRSNRSGLV